MNILVPDSWLREFLITKATPKQLKEYLSLCGPSIERINQVKGETVYDIEVTGNRPDAMSIVGIAREAAAILPRFGIEAKLVNDPYGKSVMPNSFRHPKKTLKQVQGDSSHSTKKLSIKTDSKLNPRFTAMVFENVKIGPSPAWLQKKLEQTGIRSINNVVDITNYLMRAYGQPAHVFDYDAVSKQTMILRASKKGEEVTTLDGKTHTLPGSDIVIEDGEGTIIDLCGIMGGQNSAVKDTTTNVILFLQTYDPMHIRRTSMAAACRTEAAGLFEKNIDSELVLPVMAKGIALMQELTQATMASKLYDLYPKPYTSYQVHCDREKIDTYLGTQLPDREIKTILSSLNFSPKITKHKITVTVPSFRRDIAIDVDIIEEIARLYGYHNVKTKLPDREPPIVLPDPTLTWEEEIKIRLRDWGFTETYTYSMISEQLMDMFTLDKEKAYKIANPLSNDWVYMRPMLLPSLLMTIEQNLHHQSYVSLFELSMVYNYQEGDLPKETPQLIIAGTGRAFFAAKGVAQALFNMFGIPFPSNNDPCSVPWCDPNRFLSLDGYGYVFELLPDFLANLGIKKPVTILELNIAKLVANAKPMITYVPISKYPPVVEDISFVVSAGTQVGPMMDAIKSVDVLINDVTLLDVHEDSRTFHITYLNPQKNLTNEDIKPLREKIILLMEEAFGALVKTA